MVIHNDLEQVVMMMNMDMIDEVNYTHLLYLDSTS